MATLNIYRGIQGSGKTTLADNNAFLDQGRVVGRDHIRRMIGVNGLGTRKQEQEVTEIQGRLIRAGLMSGQNVHVDDMNLKSEYVRRLIYIADECGAQVRVHDLTDVPLEACILRDSVRSVGKVGEKMIRDNWNRFIRPLKGQPLPVPTVGIKDSGYVSPKPYVPNTDKPRAVLVDLDGTTALKGDRGFHDYDERVFYDLPNTNVITVIRAVIDAGITPVYLSGRKGFDECRTATHAWINKHVRAGAQWLYMRDENDNRPDYIVKAELFDKFVRDSWNVVAAFDDRNQVVNMYREMGLTVLQVAPGAF